MGNRTTIKFSYAGDIWPVIEKWANNYGYKLKYTSNHERVYQKGAGLLAVPMMLKIKREDKETNLEAWVRADILVRLVSLFLISPEMGIESGSITGVVPKRIAREAVNKLLMQLEQPLIP